MQMPITIAVELPAEVVDLLLELSQQNTEIARRLSAVERAITRNTVNDMITRGALMADFTDLTAEVEANGDAVDSAITLLNSLSAQLTDAADDPAEIQAIADALAAQSTALATAVTANTPAAPEPTP